MTKKVMKGYIIMLGILILFGFLGFCVILRAEGKNKRIGQQVYCDKSIGSTYRGIVEKETSKYIYLSDLETQCLYGCKCSEKTNPYVECSNDIEYEFMEYIPVDDEVEKVWNKTDCYIKGDIDSILGYMNR